MYKPLKDLFSAVTTFTTQVKDDIEQVVTDNPSVRITYPNGIAGITLELVELHATCHKGIWVTTIIENDEVLEPSDDVYTLIKGYVRLNLATL